MIFLYYGQFEHYSYCENWIADALDRNGHHCLRIRRTPWFDEQRLIKIAQDNHATHLLLSKCPEIKADQLETIKKTGLKIVFWTFDWMRHPEAWAWYRPLAKVADVCFQTDGYGDNENYQKAGIRRVELHQGFVEGLHDLPNCLPTSKVFAPEGSNGFGHDVVFVGSNYTERRHELIDVLRQFSGFQKFGEPEPQLWGEEFAAEIYFSKIVIGDNFVNDVPGYWSDRVYLTLACGGFFMPAYVPGMEKEFTNHKHLVWWESFDELKALIHFYLPNEPGRKQIALGGYQLVHGRDSYDQRVRQMIEVLETL